MTAFQEPLFQPTSTWRPPAVLPQLGSVIALDTETYDPCLKDTGPSFKRGEGEVVGIALADKNTTLYLPIAHQGGDNLDRKLIISYVETVLRNASEVIMANALYDLGWLDTLGLSVSCPVRDIQVAEALLDEERYSYSLDNLAKDYLGKGKNEKGLRDAANAYATANSGFDPKSDMWRLPARHVGLYAEADARYTYDIYHLQLPKLHDENLGRVWELECEVTKVLFSMTKKGVPIDQKAAEKLRDEMVIREKELSDAFSSTDIWSPPQLGKFLVDRGIKVPRTDKGNYSVTKEFLAHNNEPICQQLNELRGLNRLRKVFIEDICLNGTYKGRIHSDYRQTASDEGGTRSGRLSCVRGDTLIKTGTGFIPISEVDETMLVWTHKHRWKRVRAKFIHPQEEMFRVSLDNGQSLVCTARHRVLTERNQWKEIQYVSKQETIQRPRNLQQSGGTLHYNPQNGQRNSGDTRNNSPHSSSDHKTRHTRSASISANQCPLCGSQIRGTKPNARKNRKKTPSIQRGVSRPQGLFNRIKKRKTIFQTSHSVCGKGFKVLRRKPSCIFAHSSHRPKHRKQPPFQPGCLQCSGPQNNSLPLQAVSRGVKITKYEPCGSYPVFDIQVEDDESYEAAGIFNHNSSNPNIQQVPKRSSWGKRIRTLYTAEPDTLWCKADYSSQEPRLQTHYALLENLPKAQEAKQAWLDGKKLYTFFEEVTGLDYDTCKMLCLGIGYGMGKYKMSETLGVSIDDCESILQRFNQHAPFLRQLFDRTMATASRRGYIRTLLGRRAHFNQWTPGYGEPVFKTREAAQQAANGGRIERAFTSKALNRLIQGSAAMQTKAALVGSFRAGLDVRMSVHDEISIFGTHEDAHQLKEIMENVIKLEVPVVADLDIGPTWC